MTSMQLDGNSPCVSLTIPTDAAFVRIARLAATGFGTMHGLSVDDLDDLRLVVDEICGYFIDLGISSPITLGLEAGRPNRGIQIAARAASPPPDRGLIDELRQQVMEALAEDLAIVLGDSETEVRASVAPGAPHAAR